MALTVGTNSGALMAQAAASSVNKSMETSMERLSTGKRINSASDDAAGVAIASRLSSEIRGTNQAIRNAMDGQALIDTAEGAHAEVENILQRMRELSVQASNDTNSTLDRTYLQDEMQQLTAEIDRIASATTWAGQALLDGTFTSKQFQIGSGSANNHTISTSLKSTSSASLGAHTVESVSMANAAASAATNAMVVTDFDLMGPKGSAEISFAADSSAKTIASAVNAQASNTGVTSTATTFVKLSAVSAAAATTMTLNGGGTSTAISFTLDATSDLTAMKNAINAVAGATGVTAAFDGTDKSAIILNEADGDNITISDFLQGAATITVRALAADGTTNSAVAAISLTSNTAVGSNKDSTIVVGSFSMTADDGFSIQDQEGGDTDVSATTGYFNTASAKTSTLSAVSAIDIGTTSGAKTAMNAIDGALRMVSAQRSDLGSVSNRLDSTVSNLTNISTNLAAGKGRIEDADFAAETTNLAKTQILQQASTAMLAQANSSKQNVLSLLQG
jgi:flagellin